MSGIFLGCFHFVLKVTSFILRGGCFAFVFANVFCTWSACGGQKRMLDALELELETVVSHHKGGGKQTQVLLQSSEYS